MSVSLEIEDGDPWWLSPNLWTVPGTNPTGTAGEPIAGQPAYVWAHVRNTGTDRVDNATVRFYWANPSVGFDRTTATAIGTAFVSLDGGGEADVLCLTPWVPTWLNDGHECILGEVFHEILDPLPPTPDFNVPTDRHVAQRNLSVLLAQGAKMFSLAFEIHNPAREARVFTLTTEQGGLAQIERLAQTLGNRRLLREPVGKATHLGLVNSRCPDEEALQRAHPSVEVKLAPGERTGMTMVGVLPKGAALVHVIQRDGQRVVGGLSVAILSQPVETSIEHGEGER